MDEIKNYVKLRIFWTVTNLSPYSSYNNIVKVEQIENRICCYDAVKSSHPSNLN
jgi:hypothetical protein